MEADIDEKVMSTKPRYRYDAKPNSKPASDVGN